LVPSDFAEHFQRTQKVGALFSREIVPLDEIERQYILYVLQRLNGNMSRAAEMLAIDRRTLYRMVERFGSRTG
jgi:DNA-binding NtrC family response regulator